MPVRGTQIFIQTPEEFAARILHPAEVVDEHRGGFTAALAEPLDLPPGGDVNVYFEVERQFMQQPARVVDRPADDEPPEEPEEPAPDDAPPSPRLAFDTTGSLISAECRAVYRVATVTANLTAALADEESCPLTDISATGFSVISASAHEVGAVLSATLRFEDKQFTGQARIQSIKQLITGETRYGLRNLNDDQVQRDLEKGQQLISAAIQREQLRRQAGR